MSDKKLESPGRRSAVMSMLGALAATACGGGVSSTTASTSTTLASSLTSSATTVNPTSLPARLTLSGSKMYRPDGKSIILRGINEGTWGKMKSGDAAVIASQGGSVVRVLIRWWGLYGNSDVESRSDGDPGHFEPGHLKQFLQEIQWCIDAGLWVVPVIDSNCGQNGMQTPEMALYCNNSNFWTDLTQRQKFKEAWIYLANILKNYPKIAFYELLPEPLQGYGKEFAPAVSSFYQELMAAIEDSTGDKRTPFLIGARDAYNINLCDEAYISVPRWTNRVVYTGDLFLRTGGTQAENIANLESRLGALVTMKNTRNVPVFIQQYGVRTSDDPGNFYLDAGLSRMNAAGIGYTGWQWRQNTTNYGEYAIVIEDPPGTDNYKQDVLAVYSKYWRA